MAKIVGIPKVEMKVTLELNEMELAALHALTVYGIEAFLNNFYKNMGTTYLKPFEFGLRTLFSTLKKDVPTVLKSVEEARRNLKK